MRGQGRRRTARGVVALGLVLGACTSGHESSPVHLQLQVGPTRALLDSAITVRVRGAHAGDHVTISTSSIALKGIVWKSSAVFTAGANGTVSTAQRPTSGAYTGVNPMGLFQDETPGGDLNPDGNGTLIAQGDDWKIAINASDGRAHTPATTITRLRAIQVGVTKHDVRPAADDGLYGQLELPRSTATRRPAIVVFGGSEGGLSTTFKSELLAAHGYPALALAYFHVPGLPPQLNRIPIEYFARAVRWLARQPGVDPHRIVLFGVSRGTEAAQLTALHYPTLVAGVVLGSPSNLVFGPPGGGGSSAWTFGGRQLPFASEADMFGATAPDNPAAVILDGDIRAPILAVCGTDDQLWGSCAHDAAIGRAQAGAPHRPILLRYTGAGHFVGSLTPEIPEYGTEGSDAAGQIFSVGGDQDDDEAGRADAWARLLTFLSTLPPTA